MNSIIQPLTEADVQWLESHSHANPNMARLKYHLDQHKLWLIDQIEARQKGSKKVWEELKRSRMFLFPTVLSAEQCTTDSLARYHAQYINAGDRVLDMTAGLGIDAIHLSYKAKEITAVDIDCRCSKALRINTSSLGIENIETINKDSVELLKTDSRSYDVIFVDPARRGDSGKRLYALKECQPDIVGNIEMIMSRCRRLIVKASPMLDVTAVGTELAEYTPDIIAVGTTDECKELLLILSGNGLRGAATVEDETETETIYFEDDRLHEAKYAAPANGLFLYEPSPAVVKMGIFNGLSVRYDVYKIGRNTHLYLSEELKEGFPGKVFRIVETEEFSKKRAREIVERYGNLSVTTRDFPMTAAEFKRRFRTGESDRHRLWAVRTLEAKLKLIVTESI